MAIKWKAIGLKLDERDLVRSLQQSPEDNDSKLTEIFMKWEESGNASWQLLLDTLTSKGVKLGAVAKDIRQVRNNVVAMFFWSNTFSII